MSGLGELTRALHALPGEALVPVSFVRQHLAGADATVATPADPTVEMIAEEMGKARSTVRAWARRIPGAYRSGGKEWRIPREALAEFLRGEVVEPQKTPATAAVRLSEWRPSSRRAS